LAIVERDLANSPKTLRGEVTAGQLDPHHKGADLGLVVIKAIPLQADNVLLRDILVPPSGQLGNLFEDLEGKFFLLEALNRVAL
jgi:hypothetical protein